MAAAGALGQSAGDHGTDPNPGWFSHQPERCRGQEGDDNIVYFANPGSNNNQQTFLHIVNRTQNTDTVTITGTDDAGVVSAGQVTFTLSPDAAKQMTGQDLENGNTDKGLTGNLDDGAGKWRLTVSSPLDLEVMSLIRSQDGFLTNLSRTTPVDSGVNDVWIFNPASNVNQRSLLLETAPRAGRSVPRLARCRWRDHMFGMLCPPDEVFARSEREKIAPFRVL